MKKTIVAGKLKRMFAMPCRQTEKHAMTPPPASHVRRGISVLWETLQCPICLDLMSAPVSTKCDHQFCRFCLMKLLDNSKKNSASCPVCKAKITRRSLQESPGFQRLVSGLQDMIQAYEHDTGTNYFTGMSQCEEERRVTPADAARRSEEVSPEETPASEHHEAPRSPSSTTEAQNDFARLMGLDDSSPLTTENEGLDSGLGGAPPTSHKKVPQDSEPSGPEISEAAENANSAQQSKQESELLESKDSPCRVIQGDTKQPLRRSSRKKKTKKSGPEKVLEEKQKKSLEKVAEWLMKVPTEGGLQFDREDGDSDDSGSSCSTSTIDIRQQNSEALVRRDDRAKGLEQQVFGAVYKRERRRASSPLRTKTKDHQNHDRTGNGAEMKSSEDAEEEAGQDSSREDFREADLLEVIEREHEGNKHQEELPGGDCVVPEKEEEAKTKLKKKTNPVQQVDADLKEQENTEVKVQKKTSKRKNKPARAPKPLVLVGAQDEECSHPARPKSEQVQVHIENYPSSEDQDAPLKRNTRNSRRLQEFSEEVQEGSKRLRVRARAPAEQSNEGKEPEGLSDEASAEKASPPNKNRRNGCVCRQDVGGIEDMDTNDTTSHMRQAEEAPNTQTLSEGSSACPVQVVPESTSPAEDSMVDPTPQTDSPAHRFPNNDQAETSVCESKCAETEQDDEKNDSEIDTEQLLRSFKTIKRKSFYLGGPGVKRSRSSEHDAEEERYESIKMFEKQKGPNELQSSPCRGLIPSSDSPGVDRREDQELQASSPLRSDQDQAEDNLVSLTSVSSVLPPNKESKRETESPDLSAVPRVVDSGICYTEIEPEEPCEASKDSQVTQNHPDTRRDGGMKPDWTSDKNQSVTAEHLLHAESSLTPEGLGAAQVDPDPKSHSQRGSGDLSINSSLRSRRRRRTQRLESSSESDCSEEELPALKDILGPSAPPCAVETPEANTFKVPPAQEGANRPSSSSPDVVNSSQGSEDLFGTPEECETQDKAGEAPPSDLMEASQFSSEVLVTQQKMEMQKELLRLEKLMALVTEVLQEKEGSPPERGLQSSGPDPQRPPPPDQDQGLGLDTQGLPTADQDQGRGLDPQGPPTADQDQGRGPDPQGPPTVDQDQGRGPELRNLQQEDRQSGPSSSRVETAAQHSTLTSPTRPAASKTLNPSSSTRTTTTRGSPSEDKENRASSRASMVLVSSGLNPNEQVMLKRFAKRVGARVVSQVTEEVTHVIMHTDERLACERTLKYFLGIAGRKWVVGFQWICECFKQKKLLAESLYEVRGDVVNGPNHQGPSRARTTDDGHLLMKDYRICFQGPFTDMTTDQMEWMVELCGAAVVRDPLQLDSTQRSHQLIIVQPRPESSSSSSYSGLSRRATVVSRGWLLDSVATYTLQSTREYTA